MLMMDLLTNSKKILKKRISAWILAFAVSITGLSVGSIKANADTKTSYPPEYQNKEWNVKHDEDGAYINHIPYDDSGSVLVLPGDSLIFDVYENVKTQEITGTEYSTTINIRKVGMVISDDCSCLPEGKTASFTPSGKVDEEVRQWDERTGTYTDTTVKLDDGYVSFTNNTNYAAYVTLKGDHEAINGYHYDDEGHELEQTTIYTLEYTALWYPAEWAINWDAKHLGLVEDATFQGVENDPTVIYPKWYSRNDSYIIKTVNPVSAGRHFTCWTVDPSNCGFDNPSEAVNQTDNGMSETTITYTPGKYYPKIEGKVVEEITFISNWQDNFTISYHAEGGTIFGQSDWIYETSYENGSYTNQGLTETPVRGGYNFDGWYYKNSGGEEVTFTNLRDTPYPEWDGIVKGKKPAELNLDVYAKWSEIPPSVYTITFNTDGGSSVEGQSVNDGNTVTKPADPSKNGYTFAGWYSDSALSKEFDFNTKISSNTTIYAKWNKLSVGSESGGGSNSGSEGTGKETGSTTGGDGSSAAPSVGTVTESKSGTAAYKVTDTSSKDSSGNIVVEAEYVAPSGTEKNKSAITVPDTVELADGTKANVTSVSNNAFKGNKTVKSVAIGNNVEEIGTGAFQNATKLTTVKLGKKVSKIGKNAFAGCTSLTKVAASGNGITTIGEAAFKGDKKLTSVDFSKSKIKAIGKNAFNGDKKLKTIKINGNSLTKVGKGAFKGIKKNAKIIIYAKDSKTYKKVVNLIKKSGAKNVKYSFKTKK